MSTPISQFLNLNDQQLYQMAEYQTALDTKDKKPIGNAVLLGVPLVDSFARASFNQGTVGAKSMTFAKGLLGWTGVIALASLYNNAFDTVKNNVPAVKKFDEKHPIASTALNWVGFWFAMDYGFKGYKKLTDKLIQKFPEKYEQFKANKANLVDKIDNSWVDKKVYQPLVKGFKRLEDNYPQVARGMKYVLPFVAPVIAISATAKAVSFMKNVSDRKQANYENLKEIQTNIKESLGV